MEKANKDLLVMLLREWFENGQTVPSWLPDDKLGEYDEIRIYDLITKIQQ